MGSSCYTCGRAVGTPHAETCPRRAWGETVPPEQSAYDWRPTQEQEGERILRNMNARKACPNE